MSGADVNGFGTYTSVVRPDGTLHGEGNGAVSYRGILYYRTASAKLARLNTVGGVFEFEVDAEGKTHSKIWEWK
jgi:hypothetical protein